MRIHNDILYSKKFLRGIRSVYKHDKHRLLLTELEYIKLTYDYIKNSDISMYYKDQYDNVLGVVAGYSTRDIHYGDVFQCTINVINPIVRGNISVGCTHLGTIYACAELCGCSQYLHVKHTNPTQRVITLRKIP